MSTISYIAGQMLQNNLQRDGVNLAVETSLLYIDVGNSRIGVNTQLPATNFDVAGNINVDGNNHRYTYFYCDQLFCLFYYNKELLYQCFYVDY